MKNNKKSYKKMETLSLLFRKKVKTECYMIHGNGEQILCMFPPYANLYFHRLAVNTSTGTIYYRKDGEIRWKLFHLKWKRSDIIAPRGGSCYLQGKLWILNPKTKEYEVYQLPSGEKIKDINDDLVLTQNWIYEFPSIENLDPRITEKVTITVHDDSYEKILGRYNGDILFQRRNEIPSGRKYCVCSKGEKLLHINEGDRVFPSNESMIFLLKKNGEGSYFNFFDGMMGATCTPYLGFVQYSHIRYVKYNKYYKFPEFGALNIKDVVIINGNMFIITMDGRLYSASHNYFPSDKSAAFVRCKVFLGKRVINIQRDSDVLIVIIRGKRVEKEDPDEIFRWTPFYRII